MDCVHFVTYIHQRFKKIVYRYYGVLFQFSLDGPFSDFLCIFLSFANWGLALQLNHLMDFVNP